MNAFNTRLFWIYCLGGGFLLLALYLPLSCTVLAPEYDPTPEYAAHKERVARINAWLGARGLNYDKIEFYEALSGKREIGDVRHPNLRDAARRLLDLKQPVTFARADDFRVTHCMHLEEYRERGTCEKDRDYFRGSWSILNDPQRVVWLMSGDPVQVAAVLPAVPDEYRSYPTMPEGMAKYRSISYVSGWTKWTVLSLVFACGFFVLRAVLRAADVSEKPYHSSTETAFSRLILAGFAPGFLFFTGLHMLTPDGKVMRFHLKSLLRLTSFADEHEALITRLTVMREKALGLRNSGPAVRQIDDALSRIRSVKDFEALSKIHGEAEEIGNLYIGKAEVEAHLS